MQPTTTRELSQSSLFLLLNFCGFRAVHFNSLPAAAATRARGEGKLGLVNHVAAAAVKKCLAINLLESLKSS